MFDNVLVCGGMPRSGTTFLHTELMNYEKVFTSQIKEVYLFERSSEFIDRKLRSVRKGKIHLDFTPEYAFNPQALKQIAERKINCFFVLRPYEDYRQSLNQYLAQNKIENGFLSDMNEVQFKDHIDFVQDNFLTFTFDAVVNSTEATVRAIEHHFGLDLGKKVGRRVKTNSSSKRRHWLMAGISNKMNKPMRSLRSLAFGLI